ncbi:MAG: hypothetical protein V3W41_13835 [Planctomycetota bacterium]
MHSIRASLLAAAVLSLLVCGAFAQGSRDEKARRLEARRLIAQLDEAAAKLKKPPKTGRRELPDPSFAALDLAGRIQSFVDKYSDLPEGARAWDLLLQAHQAAGDLAGVIRVHHDVAAAAPNVLIKNRHLEAVADVESRWGGYHAAIAILESLEKASKSSQRKTALASQIKKLQTAAAPLVHEVQSLMPDLRPKFGKAGTRALRHADRFVRRWPRHKSAPTLLAGILSALSKIPPVERLPQQDWLAFYHPDHDLGRAAMSKIMALLMQEGFYERALLYAQRLGSKKLAQQLTSSLRAINARDLGLDRNTKKTRMFDLQRRRNRSSEALETLDVARGFAADYPRCRERRTILFEAARAALALAPDEALALLKELLSNQEPWPQREEALGLAIKISTDADDADAALSLLNGQMGQLRKDPALWQRLTLKKVDLLVKLERREDALEFLQTALAQTKDPEQKSQLESKIKALESEITGG